MTQQARRARRMAQGVRRCGAALAGRLRPPATGQFVSLSRHAFAGEPASGAAGAAPVVTDNALARWHAAPPSLPIAAWPLTRGFSSFTGGHLHDSLCLGSWVMKQTAALRWALCTVDGPVHVPVASGNCTIAAVTRLCHIWYDAHACAWLTHRLRCGALPCWCLGLLRRLHHTCACIGALLGTSCRSARGWHPVCVAAIQLRSSPN